MSTITNAYGWPASGIPPIACPDWCTDPGHVAAAFRDDQRCYSSGTRVVASLDVVEIDSGGAHPSRITAMAHRAFNHHSVVLLHVEGFRGSLDVEATLTAEEALALAAGLVDAARLIGADLAVSE